jgi:hypothetical protein
LLLAALACACATPGPDTLEESLPIRLGAKIEIARVADATRAASGIDTPALLRSALEESLTDAGLLWKGDVVEDRYALELEVVDYEPGNAFKRWLLPGYGSTILRVHGRLVDPRTGAVAAEIDHQRSVVFGGAYTIGAWRGVFASVANDVVRDLENHTRAKGFFVALAPWASRRVDVPRSAQPRALGIAAFADRRPDRGRIGERFAAFGVSMGDIHMARDPADFLREALVDDLRAAGHRVDASAGPDAATLEGELLRFWVRTDTTPLYWDIVAEIELRLSLRPHAPAGGAAAPAAASAPRSATHTCEHRERTYAWPTRSLVERTLDACLADLLAAVRRDPLWLPPAEG